VAVERRECIDLVKEIGEVEHVVLTTHAYEHKLFVAPFARKFPGCQVRPAPSWRRTATGVRRRPSSHAASCEDARPTVTASGGCRCAQVWTSPGQWSFPVNLPVQVSLLHSCYSEIGTRH
jgi:Domain of unknown function (DUF4336)